MTYNLKKGVAKLSDLVDGGLPYPGNYPGKVYFVNNITGTSGASGLSWNEPFDEVSTAITASEADRALRASNNQNVRNVIYVQGTATAYTALTALPSYCDIIGVGADPGGNGAGIARIGADSGVSEGVLVSASVRGVNFENLQFQAGVGGYAFKGTNLFRSNFYNCVFTSNGSPGGAPAAGFEMGICGGVNFYNCLWNNQSSLTNQHTVGFNITSTHFHGCRVENCVIGGDVGVAIAGACVNGWGSWFKDCYIGQLSETCSIGVDDNATVGHIIYAGCFVQATDAFDLVNNANRIIGCTVTNAFTT
jgi:hypothetical protein